MIDLNLVGILTSVTRDLVSSSCTLVLVNFPAYAIFIVAAIVTSTLLSSRTHLKKVTSEVLTPDSFWLVYGKTANVGLVGCRADPELNSARAPVSSALDTTTTWQYDGHIPVVYLPSSVNRPHHYKMLGNPR